MATQDGDLASGTVDALAGGTVAIYFPIGGDLATLYGTSDFAGPALSGASPSSGSSILRTATVSFSITDVSSLAALVLTAAQGSGAVETVHDGTGFLGPYSGSSRSTTATGYDFTIARTNGWQASALTLKAIGVDALGNATTSTLSYTVTNPPAAPTVGSFSPSSGSSITRTASVTVRVTDETSLASSLLYATQGSDPVELVWDGSAFVGPYLAGSSRSSVTGGYDYVLVRSNGWQRSALTVTGVAVDGQGNVTTGSASFTITNPPAAPTVGSFSPSSGSTITRTASVTLRITDETSLASAIVTATQGSDPVEVVWDGSAFVAPYLAGSSRSSVSGGYDYVVVRAGGWQRSSLTVTGRAVDGQGNATSASGSYTVSNPPAAPTVDTYSPSNAGSLSKSSSASFRVHDETSIARVFVFATYGSGVVELVHDGSAFQAPFSASSSRSSISDGYSYVVARTGWWPDADVTLTIVAIDGQGNQTTATYTLTVTDPPPSDAASPVVSNVTPTPSAATPIPATQPLGFDVTDDSGTFARVFIYVTFASGKPAEVVYDGSGFLPYYAAGSTVAAITDGLRFSLVRAGGWPSSPTVKVFPIDPSGQEG